MLLDWGKAEAEVRFPGFVGAELIAKIKSGALLSEQECAKVTAGSLAVRGVLLGWFFWNPTEWFEGDFPVTALGTIRTIGAQELAGAATLAEVVAGKRFPILKWAR